MAKINLYSHVVRQEDWKMSYKSDLRSGLLPGDWNPGKYKKVQRTFWKLLKVSLEDFRQCLKKQGLFDIKLDKIQDCSCASTANNDLYIRLTVHQDRRTNTTQILRWILLEIG